PVTLSTKDLMVGIYDRNLNGIISENELRNGVRVVSRGGKKESMTENVIVELPGKAWKHLRATENTPAELSASDDCMVDVAECMRKERIAIALLQEPYVWEGRVRGIPNDMRVIEGQGRMKAVVVVNGNIEVVRVDDCVGEHGVCAWYLG
ncbi:hypothetical protein CBL_20681, partial [Carabus blaptoides fortunei]